MKRTIAAALLLAAACASSDDYDQPQRRPARTQIPARAAGGALDLLPLGEWWREPSIASALSLSGDQFASLDKISAERGEEVSRIERDMTSAARDLRLVLDAERPSTNDILSAGARTRSLRDSLLDHQLQMLAAERAVLTRDQWLALQQQLQSERSQRRDDDRRGGRGTGGRGGRGGRRPF